jgi:hypothetical protein
MNTKAEDDITALVCGKIGGGHAVPVPGATIGECSECHEPIWIAPSSTKISQERPVKLICTDCVGVIDPDWVHKMEPPTDSQMQEIMRYFNGL